MDIKNIEEIRAKLPDLSFNDCLRSLRELEKSADASKLKPLKIAVLRSYTVEMLEPVLRLRLLLEGFRPYLSFGDYNSYVQEILDPASALYKLGPDVVLVMTRIEEVIPDIIEDFGSKTYPEWEDIVQKAVKQMSELADRIGERLTAQIIFQNMCNPENPYWGVYDVQIPEGQRYLIDRFNHLLASEFKLRKSAFIWDFNGFVKEHGYNNIYDPKMWYTSKNPFKQSAYPLISNDITKYLLSIMGRVKKCIVLDLDNTLWGGIAGEDGFDGIALGHNYPGSCYRDFQKGLLRLYHRGIMLAINSKNNEGDALEIIEKHPYMILRRKYFAAMQINWNDKVSNIKAIAKDLNIGLDSMIFIDDNPVECELVRENCPEVDVVCLPDKQYLIPSVLNTLSGIENIRLTEEDKLKGEMYKAQTERKHFESSFENLEDFLAGLEIEVNIEAANNFTIPRIAQLTQKTNQMNLTTRRYTEADIQTFLNNPDSFVFSAASKDRFGDNGIIGVFILKIHGTECIIDTFLLSCRVIGRNIEHAMIAFIAEFAREKDVKILKGEYIPTAKNKPAADMYEKFQFKKTDDNLFTADLEQQGFDYPPYIKHAIKASV